MESWLFLIVILAVALLGRNQSLVIAVAVVMLLKLLPQSHEVLNYVGSHGINWGVTIISIAILVPIATGKIGFQELVNAFKTPAGFIAVGCGILVAVLSARGVGLLSQSPEITIALVFGTIVGVVFFKGIAAGPVIASGMTYVLLTLLNSVIGRW
ncbi:DUF441 domain-containing protein [Lapidilactobacillus gannanensis]|uniref:UPF0756 membrane protein ACFQ4R_08285 n=1 Tax=Lapidilactobacillus gannanensis TaxID=2486002 RepID=A0ABW4BPI1_9LACO|nr:DUF441 domain-containing protein [Lapidilactobacillus gannanensis]MCH4057402.1 DUF441 domain-containing protein [Lactobacillaceae bacterium]